MKYTLTAIVTTLLVAAALLFYLAPAHAYTSGMHEYYRVLRDHNEAYGYVPYRNHDPEDQLEEQNDQLELLRQELRTFRNTPAAPSNTCVPRARGQVPSASINC